MCVHIHVWTCVHHVGLVCCQRRHEGKSEVEGDLGADGEAKLACHVLADLEVLCDVFVYEVAGLRTVQRL